MSPRVGVDSGPLLIAVASRELFAAFSGFGSNSDHVPNDSEHVPNDSGHVPNDSEHVPNDPACSQPEMGISSHDSEPVGIKGFSLKGHTGRHGLLTCFELHCLLNIDFN